MAKAPYQTKQMAEILAYLRSVPGRHVTVQEICAHCREAGAPVGTTTVYRQLERLVREGQVAKYVVDGACGACFEYIGEPEHCHQPSCFHCKCEQCGKLIHLQCDEIESLEKHMLDRHGFTINSKHMVFYGVCEDCRKNDR